MATTPTLSDHYAATVSAEKALIVALEAAMEAFTAAIDTATADMPVGQPQNTVLAFATRLKMTVANSYELTTLKSQYGLNPATVTPAMPTTA